MTISQLRAILDRAQAELGDVEVVHAGSEWELDIEVAYSVDGSKLVLAQLVFGAVEGGAKRWLWEMATTTTNP